MPEIIDTPRPDSGQNHTRPHANRIPEDEIYNFFDPSYIPPPPPPGLNRYYIARNSIASSESSDIRSSLVSNVSSTSTSATSPTLDSPSRFSQASRSSTFDSPYPPFSQHQPSQSPNPSQASSPVHTHALLRRRSTETFTHPQNALDFVPDSRERHQRDVHSHVLQGHPTNNSYSTSATAPYPDSDDSVESAVANSAVVISVEGSPRQNYLHQQQPSTAISEASENYIAYWNSDRHRSDYVDAAGTYPAGVPETLDSYASARAPATAQYRQVAASPSNLNNYRQRIQVQIPQGPNTYRYSSASDPRNILDIQPSGPAPLPPPTLPPYSTDRHRYVDRKETKQTYPPISPLSFNPQQVNIVRELQNNQRYVGRKTSLGTLNGHGQQASPVPPLLPPQIPLDTPGSKQLEAAHQPPPAHRKQSVASSGSTGPSTPVISAVGSAGLASSGTSPTQPPSIPIPRVPVSRSNSIKSNENRLPRSTSIHSLVNRSSGSAPDTSLVDFAKVAVREQEHRIAGEQQNDTMLKIQQQVLPEEVSQPEARAPTQPPSRRSSASSASSENMFTLSFGVQEKYRAPSPTEEVKTDSDEEPARITVVRKFGEDHASDLTDEQKRMAALEKANHDARTKGVIVLQSSLPPTSPVASSSHEDPFFEEQHQQLVDEIEEQFQQFGVQEQLPLSAPHNVAAITTGLIQEDHIPRNSGSVHAVLNSNSISPQQDDYYNQPPHSNVQQVNDTRYQQAHANEYDAQLSSAKNQLSDILQEAELILRQQQAQFAQLNAAQAQTRIQPQYELSTASPAAQTQIEVESINSAQLTPIASPASQHVEPVISVPSVPTPPEIEPHTYPDNSSHISLESQAVYSGSSSSGSSTTSFAIYNRQNAGQVFYAQRGYSNATADSLDVDSPPEYVYENSIREDPRRQIRSPPPNYHNTPIPAVPMATARSIHSGENSPSPSASVHHLGQSPSLTPLVQVQSVRSSFSSVAPSESDLRFHRGNSMLDITPQRHIFELQHRHSPASILHANQTRSPTGSYSSMILPSEGVEPQFPNTSLNASRTTTATSIASSSSSSGDSASPITSLETDAKSEESHRRPFWRIGKRNNTAPNTRQNSISNRTNSSSSTATTFVPDEISLVSSHASSEAQDPDFSISRSVTSSLSLTTDKSNTSSTLDTFISSTQSPDLNVKISNPQNFYDVGDKICGTMTFTRASHVAAGRAAVILVLSEYATSHTKKNKSPKSSVVLASCRQSVGEEGSDFYKFNFELAVPETYPQHIQMPLGIQRRLPPTFMTVEQAEEESEEESKAKSKGKGKDSKKRQTSVGSSSFPGIKIAYNVIGIVSTRGNELPSDADLISYLSHVGDDSVAKNAVAVPVSPSYSPVDIERLENDPVLGRRNSLEKTDSNATGRVLVNPSEAKTVYKGRTSVTESGLLRNSVKTGIAELHLMGLQYYSTHDEPSTGVQPDVRADIIAGTNGGKNLQLNFLFFPDPTSRTVNFPTIASVAAVIRCRQVVSLTGSPFISYPYQNGTVVNSHGVFERKQEATVYEKTILQSKWELMPTPAHMSKSTKLYYNSFELPFSGLRDLQNSHKYQSSKYNLQIVPSYISAYSCRDYEMEFIVKFDPPRSLKMSIPLTITSTTLPVSSFPFEKHPDLDNL